MNEKIFHQDLEMLSDDELAVRARSSDAAMLLIMSKSMPLILHRVTKLFRTGVERDDLIQEARIALFLAVRSFSLQGGASFKTYSDVCIRNRLNSVIKAKLSSSDAASLDHLSLDAAESDAPFDGTSVQYDSVSGSFFSNPEDVFLFRENIDSALVFAQRMLSDFEFNVFRLYLSGESYDDISVSCETTVKAVDNALQRIRRKLKIQTEK